MSNWLNLRIDLASPPNSPQTPILIDELTRLAFVTAMSIS